ncbi:MAG: outer membrane protein assembly factor BamA [Proteobacteria bacterium]|nr:MAG: outer membrane protein assembly factor BamA [Pseudomonadota bacterium]
MKKQSICWAVAAGSLLMASQSVVAATFVVRDIRVNGLQRVQAATVMNYLPFRVGQPFDDNNAPQAIRSLYQTGLFEDVQLGRQGDVLVVTVTERPAIGEITISGNSQIGTEQLQRALKAAGVGSGDTLDRAALLKIQRQLEAQYLSRGYYGVKVNTSIQQLGNNRVGITIKVSEGKIARIQQVRIIGNRAFPEAVLLKELESGPSGRFSIPLLSKRDQYAREKLAGDLDALNAFYRNRGYLNFEIVSTQVSLTPDRQGVYITINVNEGDQYRVGKVNVTGNTKLSRGQINQAVKIRQGAVFSQRDLEETRKSLSEALGKQGYAFAKISARPDIDEYNKRVGITLNIDTGQRTYVRRINIRGNNRTRDEVYRREIRQLESSWFSAEQVERSKIRLQRLPYVEEVSINTEPVAGVPDQVDINIVITERSANNFRIGAGYSQSQGLLLNLSLNQNNFMGTGKKVEVNIDNSDANKNYLLSYTNPYYTPDGVSRGFSFYYNEYDAAAEDISDYASNRYGANVRYTFPISETNSFYVSAGAENREIILGTDPAKHIAEFTTKQGKEYQQLPVTVSYVHDTRNRSIFPTSGQRHRISLQGALPGSDLQYQKMSYDGAFYQAINDNLTFSAKARVAGGTGRGDLDELPFFEKYTAGGIRSVRGFDSNSLGPRDSKGDPKGGDLLVTTTAEVLFPMPLATDVKSVKMSAFVDAGNVFDSTDAFDSGELRYSAGLGVVWLSPLGPLEVSYAKALNTKENDKEQTFQFSIGASF